MDTTTDAETDAEQAVREAWTAHLGADATTPDTNFFTAGGNSLMAASILGGLSERFGLWLPMRMLVHNPTLGALCRAVGERLARAGEHPEQEAPRPSPPPETAPVPPENARSRPGPPWD